MVTVKRKGGVKHLQRAASRALWLGQCCHFCVLVKARDTVASMWWREAECSKVSARQEAHEDPMWRRHTRSVEVVKRILSAFKMQPVLTLSSTRTRMLNMELNTPQSLIILRNKVSGIADARNSLYNCGSWRFPFFNANVPLNDLHTSKIIFPLITDINIGIAVHWHNLLGILDLCMSSEVGNFVIMP